MEALFFDDCDDRIVFVAVGVVGKAAAQDAGLSEEKRLTKWVYKVFKELWLNKIENSEN